MWSAINCTLIDLTYRKKSWRNKIEHGKPNQAVNCFQIYVINSAIKVYRIYRSIVHTFLHQTIVYTVPAYNIQG